MKSNKTVGQKSYIDVIQEAIEMSSLHDKKIETIAKSAVEEPVKEETKQQQAPTQQAD